MSNILRPFFCLLGFFIIPFLAFAKLSSAQADSITQRAEYLFRYEKFDEGISSYEILFEEDIWTEETLYRLAFMHEQEGNFSKAIFFLRKIQWEYGGNKIDSKIAQLLQKFRQERQPLGNMWTLAQQIVHRYLGTISIILLLSSITVTSLTILIRKRIARAIGLMLSTALLLFCLLTLANHSLVPKKAVIINDSSFFAGPGYASEVIHLPIGPGTMVDIKDQKDIWTQIQTTRFVAWVPTFILKKI
ncbi:MAG: hypothetical protein MRZ79_01980 [Bacteroidia bacterium]|nr:hypothetical protein [Bacteroidia bacterium]